MNKVMRVAFFDTHSFERQYFSSALVGKPIDFVYFEAKLNSHTAHLARGYDCVCVFVNDRVDKDTVRILSENGIKLIALRSAGFNNVDLEAAKNCNIIVARVPEYSPFAVAEHAVALILSLNRKIYKSHNRTRDGNFSLDGLVGFDLHQKTVGVIGTGRIGLQFCKIMNGFGCNVLAYDMAPRAEVKNGIAKYVDLKTLIESSDVISLHVPLNKSTFHILDAEAFNQMKNGVMIINTGRGALIDTKALIKALKTGKIGSAGLDVYEEEEGVFFSDLSGVILQDDILARLLTFPNVLITAHQAFLTSEALQCIAATTVDNIMAFATGKELKNRVIV